MFVYLTELNAPPPYDLKKTIVKIFSISSGVLLMFQLNILKKIVIMAILKQFQNKNSPPTKSNNNSCKINYFIFYLQYISNTQRKDT